MSFFTFSNPLPEQISLVGTYSTELVSLSVFLAIVAGVVAMRVLRTTKATAGPAYLSTLVSAGAILGLGVWAMHFIGMLAYEVCIKTTYNLIGTAVSIVPAIVASIYTLHRVRVYKPSDSLVSYLAPSLALGIGIGLMHYGGMLSIESSASVVFDVAVFLLSIGVAILFSFAAISTRFWLTRSTSDKSGNSVDVVTGVLFGAAITGMHYTGMAATTFYAKPADFIEPTLALELVWLVAIGVSFLVGFIFILNSYARLKAAQVELKRAYYIIEGSNDAIITKTLDGIVTSWNEGARKIFGYQGSQIIGKSILALFPDGKETEEKALLARIRAGESLPTFEATRKRKDGSLVDVSVTLSPLRNDSGEVVGATKIAQDISSMRAIDKLTQERDKAAALADAKTMFLANMSHELRTPLNAIIGFSDVLLGKLRPEDERSQIETIRNSGYNLLQLVNNILDGAKLERGSVKLDVEPFLFSQLFDELIRIHRLSSEKKSIGLSSQISPQLLSSAYLGDGFRIRQLLDNLMSNAVKFTSKGEVKLVAYPDNNLHGVVLEVHDTGIGMTADFLEHIFEPFTQADASTSRRYGGTGLGVSIAKQLTELMGGTIRVTSEVGRGTIFKVHLPIEATKQIVLDEHGDAVDSVSTKSLKILAVDDIEINLSILRLMLTEQHTLVTCSSGEAAIQEFCRGGFDVVLMDIQMPGMDGFETTRKIRACEAEHNWIPCPVIALTASVLDVDRMEASKAGMSAFVFKPISKSMLKRVINEISANTSTSQSGLTVISDGRESREFIAESVVAANWAGTHEAWLNAVESYAMRVASELFNDDKILVANYFSQLEQELRAGAHALGLSYFQNALSVSRLGDFDWHHLEYITNSARQTIEYLLVNRYIPNEKAYEALYASVREIPLWISSLMKQLCANWDGGAFDVADKKTLELLRPFCAPSAFEELLAAHNEFDADKLVLLVRNIVSTGTS